MMRKQLEDKYHALTQYFDICDESSKTHINKIIKESLYHFVNSCETPAIWCYGKHTKMLMTDFIFEMKGVRLIVDETHKGEEGSGFSIIGQEQITKNKIDGIIISSFKYKEEIKNILKAQYKDIRYLDIYDALEKNGIFLANEYFESSHPYGHYLLINEYKRKLKNNILEVERQEIYTNLIREYIKIKDFQNAILWVQRQEKQNNIKPHILSDLQELYNLQQEAVSEISDKNVVMICIDGLRRQDFFSRHLNKLRHMLEESAYVFRNAYSVSTSTYESLIPAYSQNSDLRTGYYETNSVKEGNCIFIQTAIEQKRKIHFYTDSVSYINSDKIQVTDFTQSVTEKIWDFILDAVEEENGLFYIHILYESHFSYPNPYTEEKIIADGSSILFDFLSKNGGNLRTDYETQHKDAISYIDDVLYPLLVNLKARFVLFADHGNIILPKNTKLGDISYVQNTFHEDLIQIPLVMKSPEMGVAVNDDIISLISINDILVSLLRREKYIPNKNKFIKIMRSELYNPDFCFLYKKNKHERGLLAFEGFIFDEGYKLIVYADGVTELYKSENDQIINDNIKKNELINRIKDAVTVTDRLV